MFYTVIGLSVILVLALGLVAFSFKRQWKTIMVATSSMLGVSLLMYYHLGGWGSFKAYYQKQQDRARAQAILKTMKGPEEVIQRLNERLKREPNSARGWYLLGRLYANQQNWVLANQVYRRASNLEPNQFLYRINAIQSSAVLHHGKLESEDRDWLNHLLAKDPKQGDALAMLSMDAYANQRYDYAIQCWETLLSMVPSDSDTAKTIRLAIVNAEKKRH